MRSPVLTQAAAAFTMREALQLTSLEATAAARRREREDAAARHRIARQVREATASRRPSPARPAPGRPARSRRRRRRRE